MKKQVLALFVGFMTMASFAQKNELKAAKKALKKQDFITAMTALDAATPLMAAAPDKMKAQYFFFKGQALAGKKEFRNAGASFRELKELEERIGKMNLSKKAAPFLDAMIKEVSERAIQLYGESSYNEASEGFYTTYLLSPVDTSFLFNAAISATQGEAYDVSLNYYKVLKDVGYTGLSVMYMATNVASEEEENLGTKQQRDLMVKSGTYSNPKDVSTKSRRADIVKNIGMILTLQGKVDEAIVAVQEARKENPGDLNLLLTEADLYIKLKRMDKFETLMKEAVALDPTNPTLYFNLGVVNYNQERPVEAKVYYLKAIEFNAEYADAYMNLAVLILDKDEEIIEEMNNNLSNFKKYDALEQQQKAVYAEALPYLEKADGLNRTIDTVRTLLNIYENLEMEEKAVEFRALYKALR